MQLFKAFLKKKDIEFSVKRYLQDALSAMALGLFGSLLIGTIFQTLGNQLLLHSAEKSIAATTGNFLVDVGKIAITMMGPAIGVAVAGSLHAPLLVVFCSVVSGALGAELGGPAGAFIAAAIGAEFGKAVSKETKVDILVTPAVVLLTGGLTAKLIGPGVAALMNGLGRLIMNATTLRPFVMGVIVAVVVGWVLTAPISSAALCVMLGLSGLAGGAAVAGCCAQMVGFAVASYRENGIGGLVAQGLGTSMLQVSNIIRHPWIIFPPTIAAAVCGPISTCIFHMKCIPTGSGMGTCGLVGQIGTLTAMGFSSRTWIAILIVQIALPALISFASDRLMRRVGLIHDGDYALDL